MWPNRVGGIAATCAEAFRPVETEGQAAVLDALGCEYAQGYLYGRPVPAEEMSIRLGAPTGAAVRR